MVALEDGEICTQMLVAVRYHLVSGDLAEEALEGGEVQAVEVVILVEVGIVMEDIPEEEDPTTQVPTKST